MNTTDKPPYEIVEGRYIVKSALDMKWVIIKHIFTLSFHLLTYVVIYFASFLFTFFIFENCITIIPENIFSNLEPSISLGAIFATFGSAIITIYSLYCNEQLRRFHETIDILQTSLLKTASWRRWQFLKRYHIARYSHRYVCYYLTNPGIIFKDVKNKLELILPYTKEDFYELPIYLSYFRILKFKKKYFRSIQDLQQISSQPEFMLLNCLSYLYQNILNYKKGRFLMVIGCFFIFNSILFSLFHYAIREVILLLHQYVILSVLSSQ